MKSCFLLLLVISLFTSCADDPQTGTNTAENQLPDSTNKPKQFFPILDYLKGEVRAVDSFIPSVKQVVTINGKTDSAYLPVSVFDHLMQEFLPAELSKENFEKYYSESSFFDETTQTSTFTYATKNDDLEFHRIDVLVTGTETFDKVSSVYMEKFTGNEDSSVVKKILFRSGKSVVINSETTTKGNATLRKQEKLVWNEE